MSILWRRALTSGHSEIDDQHKELLSQINSLLLACSHNTGLKVIADTMTYLENYAKSHFHYEETLMERHHYAEYEAHRLHHTEFINKFNTLKSIFEKDGPTIQFVMEANQLLVDWLVSHVNKDDTKMAVFLAQGTPS